VVSLDPGEDQLKEPLLLLVGHDGPIVDDGLNSPALKRERRRHGLNVELARDALGLPRQIGELTPNCMNCSRWEGGKLGSRLGRLLGGGLSGIRAESGRLSRIGIIGGGGRRLDK
jgi:hypothetical protein